MLATLERMTDTRTTPRPGREPLPGDPEPVAPTAPRPASGPRSTTSLTALGDGELVGRCLEAGRSRDEAFATLYARHSARVFGFLLMLTRSREAAEDALQETFVRVHKSLERFDRGRDLGAWLLQIARFVAIDAFRVERKVKRLEERTASEAPPPGDVTTGDALARERQALVHAVLDELAIEDRALLVLRHFHGMTFGAIGEATDCSSRTAQNRVEAAARRFQQALARRRVDGDDL
jgi:RNA polymerase sigma-70 factor (ECF subfamily)